MNENEHHQKSVETIAEITTRAEAELNRHERLIERATRAVGRPRTIYAAITVAIAWMTWNTVARPLFAIEPFDRFPFEALQGLSAAFALLVALMVLTTQLTQEHYAHVRANLVLQVSILAEQKIAKLIQLVEELRVDLPMVRNRPDPVAEAMQTASDTRAMVDELATPPKKT